MTVIVQCHDIVLVYPCKRYPAAVACGFSDEGALAPMNGKNVVTMNGKNVVAGEGMGGASAVTCTSSVSLTCSVFIRVCNF